MDPKSKERPHASSLPGGHGGRSAVKPVPDIPGAGQSQSHHPSTNPVPDVLLPAGSSVPQYQESQPQTHQSSSNDIHSMQQTAVLIPMPSQPFPTPHSYEHVAGSRAHGDKTSFLANASGCQMGDIQYVEAPHSQDTVLAGGGAKDRSINGWELLLRHTAPDALHNSSARHDAPKCDQDTRVEVTSKIMAFIDNPDGPLRLLCMTGAAGSGKSALQQTIAERCGGNGSLAASYFFSADDLNRSTIDTVIPTIAYQLGTGDPPVKQLIKAAVEDDPLIFFKSLQDQINTLIVEPFKHPSSRGFRNLRACPCAILIDGLDECKGEDYQAELLASIRQCLLVDWLPFRIFIASRPERAIRTALEPGGHLHPVAYHIQLSDQYDASADMRRYLRRRFEEISLSIGDPNWFTEGNIETLVQAASGQFIYVTTAYKYVSERPGSPAVRLDSLLSWTRHAGRKGRPFDALDRLYTSLLLAAKEAYEAIDSHHGRDFLLLFRAHHINIRGFQITSNKHWPSAPTFSETWLGLEARAEEILISDLHSLVTIRNDGGPARLHLYHESFSDFLEQESRAKDLFVPEARVHAHFAKCFMRRIIQNELDFNSVPYYWEELPFPKPTRVALGLAVDYLPALLRKAAAAPVSDVLDLDDEVAHFIQNSGWQKIDNLLPLLYYRTDGFLPWCRRLGRWIESLRQYVDNVKARRPEVAAVISGFVADWIHYKNEWYRESSEYEDD